MSVGRSDQKSDRSVGSSSFIRSAIWKSVARSTFAAFGPVLVKFGSGVGRSRSKFGLRFCRYMFGRSVYIGSVQVGFQVLERFGRSIGHSHVGLVRFWF